jgi:hypothetical protein
MSDENKKGVFVELGIGTLTLSGDFTVEITKSVLEKAKHIIENDIQLKKSPEEIINNVSNIAPELKPLLKLVTSKLDIKYWISIIISLLSLWLSYISYNKTIKSNKIININIEQNIFDLSINCLIDHDFYLPFDNHDENTNNQKE